MLPLSFSRREAATWVLVSCFAAYTGPFGTYGLELGWRLVYWTLVVVISAVMANIFTRLARRLIGPDRRLARDILTVGLMTAFFTPVLIWLSRQFMSEEFNSAADAFYFGQYVTIITIGVVSGRRVLPGVISARRAYLARENAPDTVPAPPDPEPDLAAASEPRLMRRLPSDFTGPILRLTSEDHFVDVIAPAHTHRLRMRLADAMDEMDPVDGICTHRSHWVARDAIDGVERTGGRVMLRLNNGDLVPVSRTYRPKLEAAGLI